MEPIATATVAAIATATPTATPVAGTAIGTVVHAVGWGFIVQSAIQMFTGIAQHPVSGGIGVTALSCFLGAIWFFVKGKFKAWQEKNAINATQQGESTFVQNQSEINQQNNTQDNKGRKGLDDAP